MENSTMPIVQTFPSGVKIALYSLLVPCSLIGNVLVVAVVRANPPLQTRFNYIIVNLALSDLIIPLMALPREIVVEARGKPSEWLVGGTFGTVLCKFYIFVADISPGVSVFSLVVIAVNRFFAIVYPLRITRFSRKKLFCVISFTWIIAMIFCSPHLYTFRVVAGPAYQTCVPSWEPLDPVKAGYVFFSVFVIGLFLIPFFIITVLYSILTYKIYKMSETIQNMLNNQQAEYRQRRNRQIFYMSVVVVLVFALLWGPFFGFIFVFTFVWKQKYPLSVLLQLPKIFFVLRFLGYSNSVVNPWIYFLFMKNFRQGLKKLFRRNITDVGIPLAGLQTTVTSTRYSRDYAVKI